MATRVEPAVFPPLRRRVTVFPPLRRGGRGGGPGTTSHRRFPRSLPLSPFASLSRGEKNRSRPSRLLHHPPYPPFARGGKGIACDVVSRWPHTVPTAGSSRLVVTCNSVSMFSKSRANRPSFAFPRGVFSCTLRPSWSDEDLPPTDPDGSGVRPGRAYARGRHRSRHASLGCMDARAKRTLPSS